jgi:hypothetical protein
VQQLEELFERFAPLHVFLFCLCLLCSCAVQVALISVMRLTGSCSACSTKRRSWMPKATAPTGP